MEAHPRCHGVFVSASDTSVGKTYVACRIVEQLVAEGRSVGVYKPAASGCCWEDGRLICDDALALWNAAGKPGTLAAVCPQRFLAPLAPHLAARAEGRQVGRALLRTGLDYWRERSECIVVEGAGGLLSPLSDDDLVADVARDVGFAVVIVVRNALGAINQALLTLAVATRVYELPVAAIVLSDVEACQSDASRDANTAEIAARCAVPVTRLRHGANQFEPPIDWLRAAGGVTSE